MGNKDQIDAILEFLVTVEDKLAVVVWEDLLLTRRLYGDGPGLTPHIALLRNVFEAQA